MGKGKRKARSGQRFDEGLALAPGATELPTLDGSPPERMPVGVHVRSREGVQIEFMFNGRRFTETLKGPPTVGAVLLASAKRTTVLDAILCNRFVYAEHFPGSRRVLREQADALQAKSRTLVGSLLSDFLSRYSQTFPGRQSSYSDHKKVTELYLRPRFGHLRVDELTSDHIIEFRAGLRSGQLSATGEALSSNRISAILTPLRGTMDLAIERLLISRSPFDTAGPTKPKKDEVVVLDAQGQPSFVEPIPLHHDPKVAKAAAAVDPFDDREREAILGAMFGQVRNLYCFGFWTGLRTGELIALRWCDIDWEGLRVCVRLSYSKGLFTKTKGKIFRFVPLLEPALLALRNQQHHTGAEGRFVFHNPATGQMWTSTERLRRRWRRALKHAGVRYRRQYQVRHTYASARMSAGDSALAVASALGHRDVLLVSLVYARFRPPTSESPDERTARVFEPEWGRVRQLLKDNSDVVTTEEMNDEAAADIDDDSNEEVDPADVP